MLISEAKSKMIYYYDYFSKKVEEISYYDFVIEFGRDETTTPNGIAPRKFISETTYITYHFNDNESEIKSDILYYLEDWNNENLNNQKTEDDIEVRETTKWEIRTWRIGGNAPSNLLNSFDTKEEAEQELFEYFEYEMTNNDVTPQYFNSQQEAQAI